LRLEDLDLFEPSEWITWWWLLRWNRYKSTWISFQRWSKGKMGKDMVEVRIRALLHERRGLRRPNVLNKSSNLGRH
jgi:hypothetical protein